MPKPKQPQSNLFGSDSEDDCGFKTNESYANHYNEFRKKEILSHLKDISESDSSDDASTDEELVNPEFDKEFLKSLAFLKSKDPNKYQRIPKFFENVPTVEETIKEKQAYKSKKPVTVADYQRERLIKTDGRMSEEDDEVQQGESLSYAKEQEKIKNDLRKALESSSDEEDEDNKLLKVREKPKEELEKEGEDYLKWLAGQKREDSIGEDAKVLKPLKDFWTSNKLPKADQFLRDYIVNKRYMDETNVSTYEDVVGLSEDEEEVEQQAEFETKYNFRFEEPDNEFIKRFPRTIDDSVRAENTARKDKRKERQERKAKEKELKMKDLREIQNIRKREIEQKLMLLKEVAGNDELVLQEDDLNTDFDPDEHDRRMAAMFNNEYYGIDEGDQKPEFPDIDEDLNIENWDKFDKSKYPDSPANDEAGGHCEDDDFVMDCDFDLELEKKKKMQNELIEMSKGRKRKKKISKLAEIIKTEKPTFDPANEKTYEEYLDEYYKLDYEDIIGDQPCRFRYTECVPNDFGLTVEEILMASNKELNQWASLKKTMQNRPKNVEINDVEKYNRRRNNVDLKKKIFASIYGQPESDDDDEKSGDELENSVKIEKQVAKPEGQVEAEKSSTEATKKKKKRKKKNKAQLNGMPAMPAKPEKTATSTSKPKNPVASTSKPEAPATSTSKPSTHVKSNPEKKNKKQKPVTTSPMKEKPTSSPVSATKDQNKQNKPFIANPGKRKLDEATDKPAPSAKKMKFNKNQNQKKLNGQPPSNELSENRLKAFGINPKKFKNKIKYGGGDQQKAAKKPQKGFKNLFTRKISREFN